MSWRNSGRSRSASSGVSPTGAKFQNSPWWTSTSCARSCTARSNSSRWAVTPVTTRSIRAEPGYLQPVGTHVLERGGIQQLVERTDQLVDVGHLSASRVWEQGIPVK